MLRTIRLIVVLLQLALASGCSSAPAPATAPSASAAATFDPASTASAASAVPNAVSLAASSGPAEATAATSETEVIVFAAASLTDAFKEIATGFVAANRSIAITFNFAGSDQLAQQIVQGAPADVFASANKRQMDVVIQAGDIISGTEHTFVRNRLVVVYPNDNPGKLQTLKDLARPGLKIVLANQNVPIGAYSLDVLSKASQLPAYPPAYRETVLKNVVSYEETVKAVLSKVRLGEADAGIVYTTDAATVKDGSVGTLAIPDSLNVVASYPIAATKSAKHSGLAQKFVDYVLAPEGQQILATYGFIPATMSAGQGASVATLLGIGDRFGTSTKPTLDPLVARRLYIRRSAARTGTGLKHR